MKYGSQKHLDYLKRRLQQVCKTKRTVTVEYVDDLNKRTKAPGWQSPRKAKRLGTTFTHEGKEYIWIEKNMSFEIKAQTLIHEWAHVMTPANVPDHGRKWANNYCKAYRKVYRVK